ncbi:C-type lectin domain family 6 member A-like [Dunckerocampus dactyliophorus]|uniref:C-type lectin domain family 6 member A-like n=1 Tax=Dunckerocampus dactyliophorus TaxID=161453 RepID=UPI002404AC57|nr:C-type lectin domain family 6 member A-like [Dunckerocampus dactyliophorus]
MAELKKSIHRLNESMFGIVKSLQTRVEHLEGKAGNSQNQTGQVKGMTGESQNQTGQVKGMTGESQGLTGYMKKMVEEFQKMTGKVEEMTGQMKEQTGHMEAMIMESQKQTKKVEEMTGQMKEMTQDAVDDLLMKAGCCPLPWHYHDKRCYMFVNEKKTWNDAQKYCVAKGGHLASVHTKTTHDFLYGLAGGHYAWVGGYKENNDWKWVDGSTFNVKKYEEAGSKDARWAAGEPNSSSNRKYCAEMWSDGGLNDFLCYYQQPFICQK